MTRFFVRLGFTVFLAAMFGGFGLAFRAMGMSDSLIAVIFMAAYISELSGNFTRKLVP